MIRLVPSASTQIGATPDDPGTRRMKVVSMPSAAKSLEVRRPVAVVPDGVDHRDLGPEPGGHDGLVRTLPAEARLVARPDDGLAVAGQAVGIRDEVDHRAAHDDDPRRGHHDSSDNATTSRS